MRHEDVEIISDQVVYAGFYKMRKLRLKHRLFAGGWSQPFEREIMQRPPAVVVLPYDPDLDEVILIEEFRVGALADAYSPWLLELVAGLVNPGESWEQVAERELREETGLAAQAILPIAQFWVSPGGSNEFVSLYCAKVDATLADGIHGMAAENEDIRVHRYAAEEAFAMVTTGQINNAAAISGLFWLQLQKRRELFA